MEINESKPRDKFRIDWTLICMCLLIFIGFVLMHDLMGNTLLVPGAWDSYTLQAMAWREGKVSLDQNYSWLELAIYEGDYFVSFPPFPSVVMFPLTFIFGASVPASLVMVVYAILTAVFAYLLFRRLNVRQTLAAFIAIFYVFGSNFASISLNGSVWWHAQLLCLLLCTLSIYCLVCNRRILAYMFVALAVGCRPFSIILFPILLFMFYRYDRSRYPDKGFWQLVSKQLTALIIPAIIGLLYMWYNYVRFDNPLEFGHNYLPEFTSSEHGQFSLTYLGENLYNLFIRSIDIQPDLGIEFTDFNGFMFYIANPIFLIVIVRSIADVIKQHFDWARGVTLIAMALNILFLCCHKTLGGWQFGARYTADMLPMALLYLILASPVRNGRVKTDKDADTEILSIPENTKLFAAWNPNVFERAVCVFGLMFNIYGAIYFWIVNYTA